MISHGHVAVKGGKVTVPSYMVSKDEEGQIQYTIRSPLNELSHPARPKGDLYKADQGASMIAPSEEKPIVVVPPKQEPVAIVAPETKQAAPAPTQPPAAVTAPVAEKPAEEKPAKPKEFPKKEKKTEEGA